MSKHLFRLGLGHFVDLDLLAVVNKYSLLSLQLARELGDHLFNLLLVYLSAWLCRCLL